MEVIQIDPAAVSHEIANIAPLTAIGVGVELVVLQFAVIVPDFFPDAIQGGIIDTGAGVGPRKNGSSQLGSIYGAGDLLDLLRKGRAK